MVSEAEKEFQNIEAINKTLQVNGRGFVSKKDLETATEQCATIWKCNTGLESYLKAVKAMVAIPVPTGPKTG